MTAPGLGKKKPRIQRNWSKARAKVEREGFCRSCGTAEHVEAAHIVGRSHDSERPVNGDFWRMWEVAPDRVIPLCGPATDTHTCHGKQHNKRLDIGPLLTTPEHVQATADAGSVYVAWKLLYPSEWITWGEGHPGLMKLSLKEKGTLISALSYAIDATQTKPQLAAPYRNLRKKVEMAVRNAESE